MATVPQTPHQKPRDQKPRTSLSWASRSTPKPDVVVAIVGIVVVAVRRAKVVRIVVERAPAQHLVFGLAPSCS
jgi:hypothetical protein